MFAKRVTQEGKVKLVQKLRNWDERDDTYPRSYGSTQEPLCSDQIVDWKAMPKIQGKQIPLALSRSL